MSIVSESSNKYLSLQNSFGIIYGCIFIYINYHENFFAKTTNYTSRKTGSFLCGQSSVLPAASKADGALLPFQRRFTPSILRISPFSPKLSI